MGRKRYRIDEDEIPQVLEKIDQEPDDWFHVSVALDQFPDDPRLNLRAAEYMFSRNWVATAKAHADKAEEGERLNNLLGRIERAFEKIRGACSI